MDTITDHSESVNLKTDITVVWEDEGLVNNSAQLMHQNFVVILQFK
jgi:hypothetical protein